jgi:hypothetical protein
MLYLFLMCIWMKEKVIPDGACTGCSGCWECWEFIWIVSLCWEVSTSRFDVPAFELCKPWLVRVRLVAAALFDMVEAYGRIAWMWVFIWATTALCTCIGVQILWWKSLSFLAFHMYQKVTKVLQKRLPEVSVKMRLCMIIWIPSCCWGRLSVGIGEEKEDHTTRGRWQWKKRWAPSSTTP